MHGGFAPLALFALALASCGSKSAVDNAAEDPFSLVGEPMISDATWPAGTRLKCTAPRVRVCTPAGCKDAPAPTWLEIEPVSGAYARCDAKGCDRYTATRSYSGAFLNLAFPDRAIFARLTASGRYVETLALWDAIYVYHGQCRALRRKDGE